MKSTARHNDLNIDAQVHLWQLACTALTLIKRDPCMLRGILIGCSYGPVHQAFMTRLNQVFRLKHIPVSVSADHLNGGLDINQTLSTGKTVYQRGLLQTELDALLVNGAERLQTTSSAILNSFLDQRINLPPVLVAMDESTADETGLAGTAMGERLPVMVTLPHLPLNVLQSLVDTDECAATELTGREANIAAVSPDSSLQEEHASVGRLIDRVELPDSILHELTVLASQIGVDSLRPLLFACRVARGHALLKGRTAVNAEDAAIAVQLVLGPRALIQPGATEEPSPDEEDAPDEQQAEQQAEQQPEQQIDNRQQDDTEREQPSDDEQREIAEQLLDAVQATLPQHLIADLVRGQKINSGTGRDAKAAVKGTNGRPTGVRRPRGGLSGQRLNLMETLKSAAPRQKLRKKLGQDVAEHDAGQDSRLQVRVEDFKVTRFKQPSRTTTVFVVDASGSAALHRLAEAKGAVELLLAECYVRRDRVAMISFRGQQAQLELPPTRSLVRAKRELAGLPGGGGTPLALGLDLALSVVTQLKQAGETPVIVVMSDGKANVTRNGEPSRKTAMEESHAAARSLAAKDVKCLFIDTSPRPRMPARELAQSLKARYLPLPPGGSQQLPSLLSAS